MNDAVRALMDRTDDVVPASALAPILKMHPSVIIRRAKEGTWDQSTLGRFVISGDRVKFFREDFLQKCGFLEPKPPERTVVQAVDDLRKELHEIRLILLAQLSIGPMIRLEELKEKDRQLLQQPADDERKFQA